MIRNKIKTTFIGAALLALIFMGCSKILDEQPRNIYEPGYFKTDKGVEAGLVSLYSHMRHIYGHGYAMNVQETGTDHYTYGANETNNFVPFDYTKTTLDGENSRTDLWWGQCFRTINTASGIIENSENPTFAAEAYFFRGFDYFLLVQTFGGVPLDLGSGEMKFNTNPVRFSVRNTVPEVYTKAIIPDLKNAIDNLNDAPRVTGGVTKNVARLFLAKAYLAYAWWLENPNNIPTYPEASRVDPDGHDASWYLQEAYNLAAEGIDNPGPYSLQETYYDIHIATNDRNSEIMLYADHIEDEQYNGNLGWAGPFEPQGGNTFVWMCAWNYPSMTSSRSADTWDGFNSVKREAAQSYGRPWTRMAPPIDVFTNTFADKTNDSRYDGTFVTSYRSNWHRDGDDTEFYYNANFLPVGQGDAILSFLDEEPSETIDYSNAVYQSNIGAGVLPGRADFVISPEGISRYAYPHLWKIGTYRTDNEGGLGSPNGLLTRPFPVAKFSDFYFVAAEAAVKGANAQAGKTARDLINVIRARAGKWKWDNGEMAERIEDNSAAMVAATPQTITIDYILAELSREYFGEGRRWFDLVRTQKWAEYAGTYRICGRNPGDHTPETFTRDIKPENYLRPIPIGQLNAMDVSDDVKAMYQNPGY